MKQMMVALALCASAGMAHGFETLSFGEIALTPGFGLNLTAKDGPEGASRSAYGYLDLTATWTRQVGALTLGIELYAMIEGDSQAEGRKLYLYDDPYVDPGLWLEGERFGYLAWSYTSSAIGEYCIEAPSTGDNFAAGDQVAVGTCPAHDTRSVLLYRTPDLAPGLKLAVSYMPDTGLESVAPGEAAESASVALLLERSDDSGASWTGSLGVERVLRVEGGGAGATSWQAGLVREKDGFGLGGALSVTENGDGSRGRGYGLAVTQALGEKVEITLGLNRSESRAGGADLDESSVALIGMFSPVPDKVILDGGLWQVRRDDGGSRSTDLHAALGLSLYF